MKATKCSFHPRGGFLSGPDAQDIARQAPPAADILLSKVGPSSRCAVASSVTHLLGSHNGPQTTFLSSAPLRNLGNSVPFFMSLPQPRSFSVGSPWSSLVWLFTPDAPDWRGAGSHHTAAASCFLPKCSISAAKHVRIGAESPQTLPASCLLALQKTWRSASVMVLRRLDEAGLMHGAKGNFIHTARDAHVWRKKWHYGGY